MGMNPNADGWNHPPRQEGWYQPGGPNAYGGPPQQGGFHQGHAWGGQNPYGPTPMQSLPGQNPWANKMNTVTVPLIAQCMKPFFQISLSNKWLKLKKNL